MLRITSAPTPLGELAVAVSGDGVVATSFAVDETGGSFLERLEGLRGEPARRDDRGLVEVRTDVRDYFAGRLRAFRTPVDLSFAKTGFYRRVYEEAMAVPSGELRTYGDLAAAAGSARAWRAAGTAMRVCPVELWIPCHRIVPAGPGFGRYGGHPERREMLLRLEGAI
ncbi:MAG: methylated-DNA--[protein]-cysteine S-methyltransferase [Actinobacteria bacterium]|nr:methylated-DNA--[protein]-cysteine S-methyltransferase [Actinomycetota bacterium]